MKLEQIVSKALLEGTVDGIHRFQELIQEQAGDLLVLEETGKSVREIIEEQFSGFEMLEEASKEFESSVSEDELEKIFEEVLKE